MEFSILFIALLFFYAQNTEAQPNIFDITKYGAKPDGNADISQAFMNAWKDACASPVASTILIPKGTYQMNVVRVQGWCKAPLEIKLLGILKAPSDVNQMHNSDGWITINYVDHLTISGGGTFDGQGAQAWKRNDCNKNKHCVQLPMNLRFNFINNSIVQDVTTLDSKNFHVNVIGCHNLTFQHFTITAPGDSVNTDGIHMGRSSDIKIIDSNIGTGDDCVSIGDGSEQVNIERVNCGPGHGFSIGSLGRNMGEANVKGITVKNCTLTQTQNGVRIKTWPSSPPGYTCLVSDLHFDDIIMNNVSNPVVIDQEYCPSNLCNKQNPSLVKVSDVEIKGVRGTFSSQTPVKFVCSGKNPCERVTVGDINLSYVGPPPQANNVSSQCANVRPNIIGKQNLPVCNNAAHSS